MINKVIIMFVLLLSCASTNNLYIGLTNTIPDGITVIKIDTVRIDGILNKHIVYK